jgi:hypothetical protein
VRRALLSLLLVAPLWGCSSSSSGSPHTTSEAGSGSGVIDGGPGGVKNVVVTHPSAPPIAPASECTVTTEEASYTEGPHVPVCSTIAYPHNPPMTGAHYPVWADYKEYDAPVPWGFLVHSMEHGGVVLAYSCTNCSGVRNAFENIAALLPADPLCAAGQHRVVIVPAPDLDVPIAAIAWGTVYKATCLDVSSLTKWVTDHYAHGGEDTCAPGDDRSAQGWCP